MAFSVSPAVTVREVDATASVGAVSTTPGAIVGAFRWGPVNERILVTSETDLVNRFHKPYSYTTAANTAWTNHETFFSAAGYLAYSNSLYVTRVVSALDPNTLTANSENFEGKYPGELANGIQVAYVTSEAGFESVVFDDPITNANTITFNSNTFVIQTTTDFSSSINANDLLTVGNDAVGYQNLTVSAVTVSSAVVANTTIYTHTLAFKNRYSLPELDYSELTYRRAWGYSGLIPAAPDTGNLHVVVVDALGKVTGVRGQVLEVFENVSKTPGATTLDGSNNYFKDVIDTRSYWIKVADNALIGTVAEDAFGYEALANGSDGIGEASLPFGRIAAGWDLYRDGAEVDLSFCILGKSALNSNLANYVVQNIAEERKDCMVFISPRYEDVVTPLTGQEKTTAVLNFRNTVQNSSYWVMDTGYKYTYDKYNDLYRWVPLNGDIAGLSARIQPWESPAGYKRGIIKNVVKLAFNPNKAQRDQLYVRDVNAVISQTGQGTILFGDKTGLGMRSAFDRINVRRLFITIEKAIATFSATLLFDFNDEFTQTQFRNAVEPYLRDIQGQRGIIDFRVVSDTRVNTPDVIDQNLFRAQIYIKPARTISFIELTFVATRTSAEFDEIIGQAL